MARPFAWAMVAPLAALVLATPALAQDAGLVCVTLPPVPVPVTHAAPPPPPAVPALFRLWRCDAGPHQTLAEAEPGEEGVMVPTWPLVSVWCAAPVSAVVTHWLQALGWWGTPGPLQPGE